MGRQRTKPIWQPRPAAIYIKCDISATHGHISGTSCIKDDIVSVHTVGSKHVDAAAEAALAANFVNAWADKIYFFKTDQIGFFSSAGVCCVQLQSGELQIIVQGA